MARSTRYPSEEKECRDVPSFLQIVRELRPLWKKLDLPAQSMKKRPLGEEKALRFRGQSDVDFGLTPKFWREEYERVDEAEMRLEFMSVGYPLADRGDRRDDWSWYFLMQHYGCPTRLLDWTTSPLVALYFAVRHPKKSDAVVWIIDPWRWNRAHVKDLYGPAIPGWIEAKPYLLKLEDAFDKELDENRTRKRWPMTIEPPHIDRRIAAQGSKFVMFGKRRNMLDSPAINNRVKHKGKHAIVDRIIIQRNRAESILYELNNLGINQRSLFPDLEGLGQHIAWEWRFPSGAEAIRTHTNSRRRAQQESAPRSASGLRKGRDTPSPSG
ncbi:MAG: FRG domain-containing protein [Acidobacteriaceae bacterium]